MLRNLVFDFAALDPATAGGVAAVCRAMAEHIPGKLPGVNTLVMTAQEGWESTFPLPEGLSRIRVLGLTNRKVGMALERELQPKVPEWHRWLRRKVLQPRAREHAFLRRHQANTVVHCPYQVVHPLPPAAWNLPYVINLHDIQHEHFPEFFSDEELAYRRTHYLASAQHAMAVCVVDAWTKRDLLAHLPLPESKVFVAPIGPTWADPTPLSLEEEADIRRTHDLPDAFAFYPAQTWPHKNHARLLEALAALRREQGLQVHLVCTGHLTERHMQLVAQAESLGIGEQVRFLGLVPGPHVKALYRMARMVVIPTLFEGGAGIPVLETMSMGRPLAASTACGIPDAVGDAALLFDPLNPQDMASAIGRLWQDESLRKELGTRAQIRSKAWNWDSAAQGYADIYREVLARWNARPEMKR
jgi:glycosyltransferase involved in cell wall biosynthesis